MLKYLDLEVPEKILVTDSLSEFNGKVIELYLLKKDLRYYGDHVFMIKNGNWYFFVMEMRVLKYLDYEKVKGLKSFI